MIKRIAVIMMLLLLAAGCGKNGQGQAGEEPAAQPTAAPVSVAETTDEPRASRALVFSAKTLDGETITEEVLSRYDITMVNVWASWCPPCIGELQELGKLYERLPDNVGFLSVTVDDPGDLAAAKGLLQENSCAFICVDGHGSAGLMNGFLNRVMAIPTTLFLDKNGNEVGQWIVGVPQGSGSVAGAYLREIQARLDKLERK